MELALYFSFLSGATIAAAAFILAEEVKVRRIVKERRAASREALLEGAIKSKNKERN